MRNCTFLIIRPTTLSILAQNVKMNNSKAPSESAGFCFGLGFVCVCFSSSKLMVENDQK